jgi:hypothetical protein
MAGREFTDLINGALADQLVRLTIEALRAIRVDFALLCMSALGQSLPSHSASVPNNVRFAPKATIIHPGQTVHAVAQVGCRLRNSAGIDAGLGQVLPNFRQ